MAIDHTTTLIGSAAAICTTLSFVPQLVKIRRQGGRDLSDGMLALYLLGLALWLAYGVRIEAAEVIGANVAAGTLVMAALVMKHGPGISAGGRARTRAWARTLADAECRTETRGRRDAAADPHPAGSREVGEPVHATALADRAPDEPGARPGRQRDAAE
jgi:MtN3 and saliva related transmembrane protein